MSISPNFLTIPNNKINAAATTAVAIAPGTVACVSAADKQAPAPNPAPAPAPAPAIAPASAAASCAHF